jgi:tripartite-type tricarboxylate transporter receptor subunit TctC
MPDIVAKLTGMGVEPRGGNAEEFAALIKSELPRYDRIFKAAGITPQ